MTAHLINHIFLHVSQTNYWLSHNALFQNSQAHLASMISYFIKFLPIFFTKTAGKQCIEDMASKTKALDLCQKRQFMRQGCTLF